MTSTGDDYDTFFKSLLQAARSGRDVPLGLGIDIFGDEFTANINSFFKALGTEGKGTSESTTPQASGLPSVIRFPYARHSSYEELCQFVDAFKPLDVWPCTEDAKIWWRNGELAE